MMISTDAYRSAIGRHNNKRFKQSVQFSSETDLNEMGFFAILLPLILFFTYALLAILLLLAVVFTPHLTLFMLTRSER